MTRTAILGIGSPFGDDRAGWLVIDALTADRAAGERTGLVLAALDRPGAALLDSLRNAERAVLIDAVDATGHGVAPGTLLALEPQQLSAVARLSSHGFGVAEALALATAIGALPAELTVVGITIAPGALEAEPSAPVRAAALRLADRLQTWLRAGGPLADRAVPTTSS